MAKPIPEDRRDPAWPQLPDGEHPVTELTSGRPGQPLAVRGDRVPARRGALRPPAHRDQPVAPAGLLLAAGAGRRMGRPKALVELDGEPLVVRALRTLAEGGAAPVVVVLGARADEVRAVLPAGVRRVEAPDWAEGMGASLRAGLAALEALGAGPDAAPCAPGGPARGDRGRRRPAGRRRRPRRPRPRGLRRATGPPGAARARALGRACAPPRWATPARAATSPGARTSSWSSAATWPTPTTSTPPSSWRPSAGEALTLIRRVRACLLPEIDQIRPTARTFGLARPGWLLQRLPATARRPLAAAILARVSPASTVTVLPPPGRGDLLRTSPAVACGAGLNFGGVVPRRPSLREQAGQAPQPCLASTRSATTICSSRDAWWAEALAAERAPRARGELQAAAEAVAGVDRPVAAALALRELVPDGAGVAAEATGAAASGAPMTAPAMAVRARVRPVLRRSTVTTAVARHGRPPARRLRTTRGEGVGATAAHRSVPVPYSVSGSGSRNHRTGRGALRFRDRRAGSPSDRGHATTITARSETWARPRRDRVTASRSARQYHPRCSRPVTDNQFE